MNRGARAVSKFPWSLQMQEKVRSVILSESSAFIDPNRNFEKDKQECRILIPVHIFHNHWILVVIFLDSKGKTRVCNMVLSGCLNSRRKLVYFG